LLYREIEPHPVLRGFVECFWVLEQSTVSGASRGETIVPDGYPELVIHHADRFRRLFPAPELQPRGFLYGQLRGPLAVAPTGAIGIVAARLRPAALGRLAGVDAHELTGDATPLDAVWGGRADELVDRVRDAGTCEARVGILQHFLLGRLAGVAAPDAGVRHALRSLQQAGGRARVSLIAGSLGLGCRQLERRFKTHVGISPKFFGRLVRLQRALRLLSVRVGSGAELALECGYHDQAHMIREFRELTGQTPTAYRGASHELNDRLVSSEPQHPSSGAKIVDRPARPQPS